MVNYAPCVIRLNERDIYLRIIGTWMRNFLVDIDAGLLVIGRMQSIHESIPYSAACVVTLQDKSQACTHRLRSHVSGLG